MHLLEILVYITVFDTIKLPQIVIYEISRERKQRMIEICKVVWSSRTDLTSGLMYKLNTLRWKSFEKNELLVTKKPPTYCELLATQ